MTINISKKNFYETMSLPLGLQTMGVYSIGTIMTFSLGLSLNNKHSLNSYCFPYCICYIWKQSLKGVLWNMFSLKLGKPDTLNKDRNELQ